MGHHYTRYLGDLSGGQILKNIAQKAMNMQGDAGLRFYVFDDIADEKAFKTTYRSAMDTLPIDQAMADRIVEEANHAFHLNMNMFKELEGNLVAAIGKVLFGFSPVVSGPAARRLSLLIQWLCAGRFLVPGTSGRYRCGGLSVEQQTARLVANLCPTELVTYPSVHPIIRTWMTVFVTSPRMPRFSGWSAGALMFLA